MLRESNHRRTTRLLAMALLSCVMGEFNQPCWGQILGANFNERPKDVNTSLFAASENTWSRGFYDVLAMRGITSLETNENVLGLQRAADAGQQVLVSFKWNFKGFDRNVPAPGSDDELALFQRAVETLEAIDRPINAIVLGNEPMWETHDSDLSFSGGVVPYVQFTERLLDYVQTEYGSLQTEEPRYFLGSLNRLDQTSNQNRDVVQELFRVARDNPAISGMDLHIHFGTTAEARGMAQFARQTLGAEKDLLVTEFSPVWRYKDHLNDAIGATAAGSAFASQYGYASSLEVDEYLKNAFANQVSRQEWTDFITSQPWFNTNHLSDMHGLFEEFGVSIATLGYAQPLSMRGLDPTKPNYSPFHINWLYISALVEGTTLEAYNELYMEDWLHEQRFLADLDDDSQITLADYDTIRSSLHQDVANLSYNELLKLGDLNLDRSVDYLDLQRFFDSYASVNGVRLGDLNGDSIVDVTDWPLMLANMNTSLVAQGIDESLWQSMGDINRSGWVDRNDFRLFKNAYLAAGNRLASLEAGDSEIAAPEPTCCSLTVAACVWLGGRHWFQYSKRTASKTNSTTTYGSNDSHSLTGRIRVWLSRSR
ncbi:hypothetical protein [Aeoliella mucimassa]|uniref:Dockerin domain-containing protein n=1 Tax=Aeoliella mucimassa TaxID=2527972 RepID=A0A518ANC2_9BACT|nr:hypothetical protein [Aeoliella mucimassa]QDU56227.1 hypothetical protein Pan181_24350 [Aeoliella mucimassa]